MDVSYLSKVCISIACFYTLYLLFFRTRTFFATNRIYLLTGLVLSFIIPWLKLSVYVPDIHVIPTEYLSLALPLGNDSSGSVAIVDSEPYEFFDLLIIFYWTGVAWMLGLLVMSIMRILLLKRRSTVERTEGTTLVWMTASQPFSFFNWIFLPRVGVDNSILEHEKAHVRQGHWIDLLVVEIVHCLLWFNPVIIFYKRSVKLQHEYLADAWALERTTSTEKYLQCLLREIENASGLKTVSHFFSQTIKQRIVMMTTNRTSRKFALLYFLAFPIVSLLLFSFSNSPVQWEDNVVIPENTQVTLVVDAGHGGADTGVLASTGASEKDITLSIAKTLKTMGEAQGLAVVLTRADDRAMSLQERVDFSRGVKAVAFISLHINSGENLAQSGIECFVNRDEQHSANSLRLATALTGHLQNLKGIKVNGIKEGNFAVLKGAENPAVILELGFLTNENDYNFLQNPNNQREVCNRIIEGVTRYAK